MNFGDRHQIPKQRGIWCQSPQRRGNWCQCAETSGTDSQFPKQHGNWCQSPQRRGNWCHPIEASGTDSQFPRGVEIGVSPQGAIRASHAFFQGVGDLWLGGAGYGLRGGGGAIRLGIASLRTWRERNSALRKNLATGTNCLWQFGVRHHPSPRLWMTDCAARRKARARHGG